MMSRSGSQTTRKAMPIARERPPHFQPSICLPLHPPLSVHLSPTAGTSGRQQHRSMCAARNTGNTAACALVRRWTTPADSTTAESNTGSATAVLRDNDGGGGGGGQQDAGGASSSVRRRRRQGDDGATGQAGTRTAPQRPCASTAIAELASRKPCALLARVAGSASSVGA
jgi:hypothetical protein